MRLLAFSVLDAKVGLFGRPFFARSQGEAMRSFRDVACDGTHEVGMHPEDYTLYRLGVFDEGTGNLESEVREAVVTASALREVVV